MSENEQRIYVVIPATVTRARKPKLVQLEPEQRYVSDGQLALQEVIVWCEGLDADVQADKLRVAQAELEHALAAAPATLEDKVREWLQGEPSIGVHHYEVVVKRLTAFITTLQTAAPILAISEQPEIQTFVLFCPICKRQAKEGDYIGIVGCSSCNPGRNYPTAAEGTK